MKEKIVILSNTIGRSFNTPVKTSAIREFGNYQLISLLTSNDCCYDTLVEKISKFTKHIFVDLEKKQPLNIKDKIDQKGNLYRSVRDSINKLELNRFLNIYPIKLNDITVNATWKLLNEDFNDISGIRLGIIGIGNIGSKLVTLLTDSGVKLRCFNRDINKAISVVNSVLLTKPQEVISSPQIVRKIEHTLISTAGVIISTSELNEDLSEYISVIHGQFNVYLLGHSILKQNALKKFNEANINIKRIDVGRELISYVIGSIATKDYNVYGLIKNKSNNICSGGYLGEEDDLIVDNYLNPKWFYAKCNGMGGIKYSDSNNDLKSISEFDQLLN